MTGAIPIDAKTRTQVLRLLKTGGQAAVMAAFGVSQPTVSRYVARHQLKDQLPAKRKRRRRREYSPDNPLHREMVQLAREGELCAAEIAVRVERSVRRVRAVIRAAGLTLPRPGDRLGQQPALLLTVRRRLEAGERREVVAEALGLSRYQLRRLIHQHLPDCTREALRAKRWRALAAAHRDGTSIAELARRQHRSRSDIRHLLRRLSTEAALKAQPEST